MVDQRLSDVEEFRRYNEDLEEWEVIPMDQALSELSAVIGVDAETLRGAVDWSYALLSEPERALFCRLSVFAGSFSLEAAEAVAGFGSWDVGARPREHRPADDVVADISAAERLGFGGAARPLNPET